MMGHKGKFINGDEWDALSKRSKNLITWARGMRKKIKRKYNKRMRKQAKIS